jgi:hypothetical protein
MNYCRSGQKSVTFSVCFFSFISVRILKTTPSAPLKADCRLQKCEVFDLSTWEVMWVDNI